jgi:hypothetical protein
MISTLRRCSPTLPHPCGGGRLTGFALCGASGSQPCTETLFDDWRRLSHVGFGTLAIATAMNAAPLTVSIPVVVLAAFLLLRISETAGLRVTPPSH